ncbi:MAG: hypothetical protein WC477_05980 [Patescibacteria group bacterium]
MEQFNRLTLETGLKLILQLFDKETEGAAWDIWIAKLPYMNEENYISFADFLGKYKPKPVAGPGRSAQEMLKIAREIRKQIEVSAQNGG